jgi:hypothetical protein
MDENGFPTKFLIDGIDRLGKSSLIERIQQDLGYHLVVHYDKPKVLGNILSTVKYIKQADPEELDPWFVPIQSLPEEDIARRLYQEDTNRNMFELMETEVPIIFDRTHLGEMVYAPLYRKYDGGYIYDIEEQFIKSKPFTAEDSVRLILLTTSNFDMLVDDGLSFDPSKKEEEQNLFIEAFNRSKLTNKVIVDVHNGKGGYRDYEEIYSEAVYKLPLKRS